MGKREIDQFGVKPAGFLAKWRYKRVMIDENGNITAEAVPGKEEMNLPCIGDYKKRDRRYNDNDLITEFCNITTHTNFRVYATDCTPFATVQIDLNQAKCGYQVPLPTPIIPPSPFPGVPGGPVVPSVPPLSYGLYAKLDVCDDKNIPVNIKIYRRGYTGQPTQIKYGGASPAIISWKNKEDYKLEPIRASEFQLTLVSSDTFNLEQLYTQDEREFKIEASKGGVIKFVGFGTPEEASEEFKGGPYDVTWRATDGLGALKKIAYPLPLGTIVDSQQKFIEILTYCLAKTDLNINIITLCNLYEVKMSNGLDDDPLAQASVNPLRLSDKGAIFDCYKVLETICKQFGAFIVQDRGAWNFVRQSELASPILRRRIYNSTGFFLSSEQFNNKRVATCKGSDITILDNKPTLRIGNAYKRSEVSVDFGEVPLILYNGDFEIWDGSNFTGWTKYGGIKISRVENSIKTALGSVPNGTYSMQFDELADSGKYVEAGRVLVNGEESITLNFNVGKTTGLDYFKVRIKLGLYYLTNIDGGEEYTWVQSLATCTIPVNNDYGNIDTYKVSLGMPEAPMSAEMNIQLFGFTQRKVGQYYPCQVDNFTISKSGKNAKEGRSLYLVEQPAFYTTKAEEVKLIFGDYAGVVFVTTPGVRPRRDPANADVDWGPRPSRADGIEGLKNDYYAIRTKDGSYSTGWYEYNMGSTSAIPIGLVLARNILKAYQKPFRFLESSFLGNDISYLDIFNVNLPDDTTFSARIFALLSGDLDLISGELNNALYAEIFEKDIPTVKLTIPGKGIMNYPPIIQNPNPIQLQPQTGGIFTEQFTQEFM